MSRATPDFVNSHSDQANEHSAGNLHLIVTIHGIRTFGQWQGRLEEVVKEAIGRSSPQFVHYNFGYFSVLAFIIPIFRWLVVRRFRNELCSTIQRLNPQRVDLVGHSFGTHVIGWTLWQLRDSREFKFHTVLLAGSVLKSDFKWSSLLGKNVKRLVNDCGTADNVLLLSQFFVLFTGMAGRTGFIGFANDSFRNRFTKFGHSGYFQDSLGNPSNAYMRDKWVEILTQDEEIAVHNERPESDPWFGFVSWLSGNAEPVKLTFYLTPAIAFILWILSLYSEAETSRIAEREARVLADQRKDIALIQQSTALKSLAEQQISDLDFHAAIKSALEGLPFNLTKPERPILPDLLHLLDVAVSRTDSNFSISKDIAAWSVNHRKGDLVVGLNNGVVQTWDTKEKRLLSEYRGIGSQIKAVETSKNGKLVFVRSIKDYRILDSTSLTLVGNLMSISNSESVYDADLLMDGRYIVTLYNDGGISLLDTSSGKVIADWNAQGEHPIDRSVSSAVFDSALSPSGELFAIAYADGTVSVLSGETRELVFDKQAHGHWALRVAFRSDSEALLTIGDDKVARLWSLEEEALIREYKTGPGHTMLLETSPSQNVAVTYDGNIEFWNLDGTLSASTIPTSYYSPNLLKFTPSGRSIVIASEDDGTLELFDLQQQKIEKLKTGKDVVSGIEAISEKRFLVSSGDDISIVSKNDSVPAVVPKPTLLSGTIKSSIFSTSGRKRVVVLTDAGQFISWSIEDPSRTSVLKIDQSSLIVDYRLDSSGEKLVVGRYPSSVSVWDLQNDGLEEIYNGGDKILEEAFFLPHSDKILVNLRGNSALIVGPAQVATIELRGKGTFNKIVSSRSGKLLASRDNDLNLVVWESSVGGEPKSFSAVNGNAILFSKDEKSVFSDLINGSIAKFDIGSVRLLGSFANVSKANFKSMDIADSGTKLLAGYGNGDLIVLGTELGKPISIIPTKLSPLNWVEVEASGRRGAIVSSARAIIVNLQSGVTMQNLNFLGLEAKHVVVDWMNNNIHVLSKSGELHYFSIASYTDQFVSAGATDLRAQQMLVDYSRVFVNEQVDSAPVDALTILIDAPKNITCDDLAAQPYDPGKVGVGIDLKAIDLPTAIVACKGEILTNPNNGRLHYQLGRLLSGSDRPLEAQAEFQMAINLGHPMAYIGMYQLETIPVEQKLAFLKKAIEGKVGIAYYLIASDYRERISVDSLVDQRAIFDLYLKSSDLGYPPAHLLLSDFYERGVGVEQSTKQALFHQIKGIEGEQKLGHDMSKEIQRRSSLASRLTLNEVVEVARDAAQTVQ